MAKNHAPLCKKKKRPPLSAQSRVMQAKATCREDRAMIALAVAFEVLAKFGQILSLILNLSPTPPKTSLGYAENFNFK